MIRFFVYSNLKNYLQGGDPSKDIGSIRTFIIGGIAGAASVFGNTPVDVVKTRMQVGTCNKIPPLPYLFLYERGVATWVSSTPNQLINRIPNTNTSKTLETTFLAFNAF